MKSVVRRSRAAVVDALVHGYTGCGIHRITFKQQREEIQAAFARGAKYEHQHAKAVKREKSS
jgi:hypothetical protein